VSVEVQKLLAKSQRSLDAATELVQKEFPEFAVSRAYYAMFYIAESFLISDGLSYSSHAAVIAAFGQYFAKTGRVPTKFHRYLIDAQAQRTRGDYDIDPGLSSVDAEQLIDRCIEMLNFAFQSLIDEQS
jgi:uncharacterized protein (UPF0332 family)